MMQGTIERTFRHGHMACGIGAGARGFNKANPRVGNLVGRFECAGGIDVDAGAIRNFERMTGVPGTVMDLFDRDQFRSFHGREPDADWREATPADVRAVFGRLDVLFASYPCKGFSGLLSTAASKTDKYQALNALTLRGMWLTLEAYKDDPIAIILFENVPRIATRGRWLLDQIIALLRHYGYSVAEDNHDCGEIGWLAQSRKRFLLIARHREKVPPFVYRPATHPLRGVGEVIGKLPLPGDPVAGAMHRVPSLQWRTWVRLAFVRAGADWRSLNELVVEDGVLRDYGIVPEHGMRDNQLGVCAWGDSAPTLTGQRSPAQGRFSVADPRPLDAGWNSDVLGVRRYQDRSGTVAGRSSPTNGAYSVADPRTGYKAGAHLNLLSVASYSAAAKSVTSARHVAGGALAVADIRATQANQTFAQYGVRSWSAAAGAVTGQAGPGGGANSVADPRMLGKPRFNNTYRIVRMTDASPAVAGPGGPAGGICVADPRAPDNGYTVTKYQVTPYERFTRTVIGASTAGDGAFAVADPRCTWNADSHRNKLKVVSMAGRSPTVTGADRVGSGAISVADPRPVGLSAANRAAAHSYNSQAHYGVVPWADASLAVPGFAKYDRGKWSVADPREGMDLPPADKLPELDERLVARIIALDGTWHRPFTTLELAALQSLLDPEEIFEPLIGGNYRIRAGVPAPFDLDGRSDATKREWIGNAVPSAAARGMAETIGETLLLAGAGETFTLSSREIWVKPGALALTVDVDQPAFHL